MTKQLAQEVGALQACRALGVPRAVYYQRRAVPNRSSAPSSINFLLSSSLGAPTVNEYEAIRKTLFGQHFVDQSPRQICDSFLNDDRYLCSVCTTYRIVNKDKASREQRCPSDKPARTMLGINSTRVGFRILEAPWLDKNAGSLPRRWHVGEVDLRLVMGCVKSRAEFRVSSGFSR